MECYDYSMTDQTRGVAEMQDLAALNASITDCELLSGDAAIEHLQEVNSWHWMHIARSFEAHMESMLMPEPEHEESVLNEEREVSLDITRLNAPKSANEFADDTESELPFEAQPDPADDEADNEAASGTTLGGVPYGKGTSVVRIGPGGIYGPWPSRTLQCLASTARAMLHYDGTRELGGYLIEWSRAEEPISEGRIFGNAHLRIGREGEEGTELRVVYHGRAETRCINHITVAEPGVSDFHLDESFSMVLHLVGELGELIARGAYECETFVRVGGIAYRPPDDSTGCLDLVERGSNVLCVGGATAHARRCWRKRLLDVEVQSPLTGTSRGRIQAGDIPGALVADWCERLGEPANDTFTTVRLAGTGGLAVVCRSAVGRKDGPFLRTRKINDYVGNDGNISRFANAALLGMRRGRVRIEANDSTPTVDTVLTDVLANGELTIYTNNIPAYVASVYKLCRITGLECQRRSTDWSNFYIYDEMAAKGGRLDIHYSPTSEPHWVGLLGRDGRLECMRGRHLSRIQDSGTLLSLGADGLARYLLRDHCDRGWIQASSIRVPGLADPDYLEDGSTQTISGRCNVPLDILVYVEHDGQHATSRGAMVSLRGTVVGWVLQHSGVWMYHPFRDVDITDYMRQEPGWSVRMFCSGNNCGSGTQVMCEKLVCQGAWQGLVGLDEVQTVCDSLDGWLRRPSSHRPSPLDLTTQFSHILTVQ